MPSLDMCFCFLFGFFSGMRESVVSVRVHCVLIYFVADTKCLFASVDNKFISNGNFHHSN